MNRINSLDGIRAVSIIMVILGHATSTIPVYLTNNIFFRIISQSHLGVMIFFVISGYLITKILIKEKIQNERIDFKKFYFRRFLRIFPIFYLYLFVLILLKNTIYPDIFNSYVTIFFSAIYLWNYKDLFLLNQQYDVNGSWFMGHLWSLSMEEQFYLFWPLFVISLIYKE